MIDVIYRARYGTSGWSAVHSARKMKAYSIGETARSVGFPLDSLTVIIETACTARMRPVT